MPSLPSAARLDAPPAGATNGSSPSAPQVAVLTMARDEGHMLDRWVRHYSHHVGVDNLIVFDDSSADGSTDDLPCTVHRLPPLAGDEAFEATRMRLVSGIARGLFSCYDVVVFCDVDEFLLPDPERYDRLVDLIAARPTHAVIAPMALNVIHHVGVETDIDDRQPVLGQRRFAKFVPLMCKPSIKRVPAAWRFSGHGIMAPFEVDRELFMIHLKFHDRETLRSTAGHRQRMVAQDGRAKGSSWSVGADELVAMLSGFAGDADPDSVPEFDSRTVDLDGVVQQDGDSYRTSRPGQVQAMKALPLVRVPERLHGLV